MRLQTLELLNVCQHRKLLWNFSSGLIGVFGPNGSGKSNALNVACYSGLTNDYSRHPEGKAGLVCQQAEENDKSYIRLVFSHDGHQVELTRSLQNPSNHRLLLADGRELRKSGDIQQLLEVSLGISRQLIDRFMFVGQHDLFAFLNETPAVRAKSFAHLCGTTHAEVCWQLLGEFIEHDRPLANQVDDNRDQIREAIGELKKKLRAEHNKKAEAEKSLLSMPQFAADTDTVSNWKELCQLQEMQPQLAEAVGKWGSAFRSRNAKAKELRAEHVKLEKSRKQLVTKVAAYQQQRVAYTQQFAKWKRRDQAQQHLNRARLELNELGEPPKIPKSPLLEELTQQQVNVRQEIRAIERFLEDLDDGKALRCPTCGTPMEALHEHVEASRVRLSELIPILEKADQQVRQREQLMRAWHDWNLLQKQLTRQINTATEELNSCEEVEKPEPLDPGKELSLNQRSEQVEKEWAALLTLRDNVVAAAESARVNYAEAKKKLDSGTARIAELSLVVTKDLADAAELSLQGHREAQLDLARAEVGIKHLDGFIFDKRQELQQVGQRLKRSRAARVWLRELQDVRDNVMHRDKLPAVVHRNALQNMEYEINENLAYFDSPYSVTADETLGFTARFANGTVLPATGLSGGQKVMLALSFRLAVNSLFASQIGMMILDEPTDGLDVDNRRLAADVFLRLGRVARDRGHQVIVITHDEALQSAFDQKLLLAKDE